MAKPFTIALPVRNGGHHLCLCVESILAQNCGDFDLVILDNASDDDGAEFLRTLRDPRVTVQRSERLLGIEENWARILEIPKHEFLTTIGHDDLLHPEFLDVIARLIREHPDAGLYATHFRLIDGDGALLRLCRPMPSRETAAEFLAARLCELRDSFGTGHVLRSSVYDAVGGIPPFPKLIYADDALFLQAIGASYRATALEEAFSYRAHAASTSTSCPTGAFFAGLERYADLLHRLRVTDPALGTVLHRHFPSYVVRLGQKWRSEELLAAYQSHRQLDPAVDVRIAALTTFFGEGDAAPLPTPLKDRFLEFATCSPAGRAAYEAWRFQQRTLAAATGFLRARLAGASPPTPHP